MIYLDNAATTKPLQSALDYAQRFLTDEWYNPSAPYGIKVRQEIEAARREIVATIADPDKYDLVFTSGGTEADRLAFQTTTEDYIITDFGEHSAVFEIPHHRNIEINQYGQPLVDKLLERLGEGYELVSIMHCNNETGAINNINEIARRVKEIEPDCLFHSDGVQAFGKFPYKLSADIDLYSISAHKIGGVKGTGALIYKKSIAERITPLLYGGGQEHGLRSGTENVFGIMAFREAVRRTYFKSNQFMLDILLNCATRASADLWQDLDKNLFARISPTEHWSPYILSVSFTKGDGQALQALCHERRLIIGTGAACSTGKENRVLKACGLDSKTIRGAIRLSVSPYQSEQEIREAARILNECAKELVG